MTDDSSFAERLTFQHVKVSRLLISSCIGGKGCVDMYRLTQPNFSRLDNFFVDNSLSTSV